MSLIGKNIGNYLIKSQLGEGGMGTVYLGEHPLIGKRVAVKVLLEELAQREDIVARFFTEAKAVNDIGHPNIVDIVDFGKTTIDGRQQVYFIMEFLDGEALASRLRRTGLTFPETLHVMAQACAALAASHAKGIVHRDLKPDNIFLCPRGGDKNFVKLLDFGIAKLTGDAGTSGRTQTGTVIGTPAYMSPEQCEGKGLIDHRSDIYSLGIVMYELVTGRVPFPGDGFGEILVAQMTKPVPLPSTLNPSIQPAVEQIVMRCLEKDRGRRFQSMEEMGAAIEAIGGVAPFKWAPQQPKAGSTRQITTLSHSAAEVTAGGSPRRKSKAPVFAAFAALALLGGGGFAVFKATQKPPAKIAVEPVATEKEKTETATPPPVEKKPVDETIQIRVTSDPPGAHVLRADQGGRDIGTTPLVINAKKGDPSFDVKLTLDGYRTAAREINTDANVILAVEMAKEAPVVTNTPPPPHEPREVAHAEPKAKSKPPKSVSKEKGTKKGQSGDKDDLMKPSSIFN